MSRISFIPILLFALLACAPPSAEAFRYKARWKRTWVDSRYFTLLFTVDRSSPHADAQQSYRRKLAEEILEIAGEEWIRLQEETGLRKRRAFILLQSEYHPVIDEFAEARIRDSVIVLRDDPWERLAEGGDRWIRRQVRDQIVQILCYAMVDHEGSSLNRFFSRKLYPYWLIRGASLGWSTPWTPERRSLLHQYLSGPNRISAEGYQYYDSFNLLKRNHALVQAQSLVARIAEQHGWQKVFEIMRRFPNSPTRIGRLFASVCKQPLSACWNGWRNTDKMLLDDELPPRPTGLVEYQAITRPGALTRDQRWLALASNRRQRFTERLDLFFLDRKSGRTRFAVSNVRPSMAFSPDGTMLYFVKNVLNPSSGLYYQRVKRISTAALRRSRLFQSELPSETILQGDGIHEIDLSPDGRLLSVLDFPSGSGRLRVFRVKADGCLEEEALFDVARAFSHRWASNARSIFTVEARAEGGSLIRVADLERKSLAPLFTRPNRLRSCFGPIHSPMTIELPPGGRAWELWRHHVRAGRRFLVKRFPHGCSDPRWMNDRALLCASPTHRGVNPRIVELPPLDELSSISATLPSTPAAIVSNVASLCAAPASTDASLLSTAATLPTSWGRYELPLVAPSALETTKELSDGDLRHPLESPFPSRPADFHIRELKEHLLVDDDVIGWIFTKEDGFQTRGFRAAGWRDDEFKRTNWQLKYYHKTYDPGFWFGFYNANHDDLLKLNPGAAFLGSFYQRGITIGSRAEIAPQEYLSLSFDAKDTIFLDQDLSLADPSPRTNLLTLRYSIDKVHQTFDQAVSPKGRRRIDLTLSESSRSIGSKLPHYEGHLHWREYLRLDDERDQSLALRVFTGFRKKKEPSPYPLEFSLGGTDTLRGVQVDALKGEKALEFSIEFRGLLGPRRRFTEYLPLLESKTVKNWFYFDRVHWALFLDGGYAWNQGGFQPSQLERGWGFEFRAQSHLTRLRPMLLRLGYAMGLDDAAEQTIYFKSSAVF